MRFTVDVEAHIWYKVQWLEEVENYDQREGSYKSWIERSETFLKEDEARNTISRILKLKDAVKCVTFSTVEEIKN